MHSNYDKIASHYDFLSRLVFFKSQVNAQIQQLKFIKPNSKILIVGGGTGWILEEIAHIYSQGLSITYVEVSAQMLKLSEKRNFEDNRVDFVHQSIDQFETREAFDFILTPFLFDNFESEKAKEVFLILNKCLKEQGKWLFVDFVINNGKDKWWNLLFLKTMYLFFRSFNIISTNKLVDISPLFCTNNYQIVELKFYYSKFIKAAVYQK